MNSYDKTIEQIEKADITPKSQLAAFGLLGAAHGGALIVTKEEAGALCQTKSWGSTRRLLGKLQAAGLIHYRTNELCYVAFVAYYQTENDALGDQLRAESDQPRAESDHDGEPDDEAVIEKRAPVITFRSATREKRAMTREKRANCAGGKVRLGRYDPLLPNQENRDLPNPPAIDGEKIAALTPDKRWAFELLTDEEIGVLPESALACVKWHTAGYVAKHVSGWWTEREAAKAKPGAVDDAGSVGTGALVWRLQNPGRSTPRPITDEFLASALYRRRYPLTDSQITAYKAYLEDLNFPGVIDTNAQYVAIVESWSDEEFDLVKAFYNDLPQPIERSRWGVFDEIDQ